MSLTETWITDWLDVTPDAFIRHGGWRGLPGARPTTWAIVRPHATAIEGEATRLASFDGPMWSLELIFGADGALTHDQLQVAPELAGLDPETDRERIRERLPMAYIDDVEHAHDVAGIPVEAVHGDDPIGEESVVFLGNGVNLHYQPTGSQALLRLVTNADGRAGRALIRQLHARRR